MPPTGSPPISTTILRWLLCGQSRTYGCSHGLPQVCFWHLPVCSFLDCRFSPLLLLKVHIRLWMQWKDSLYRLADKILEYLPSYVKISNTFLHRPDSYNVSRVLLIISYFFPIKPLVSLRIATTEGSLIITPFPRTCTSVFAVPSLFHILLNIFKPHNQILLLPGVPLATEYFRTISKAF